MKARKRPVIVDVEYFDGTHECGERLVKWISAPGGAPCQLYRMEGPFNGDGWRLDIETLEGVPMTAVPGDWIIRDVNDECYPCKPDIFTKTYELLPLEETLNVS